MKSLIFVALMLCLIASCSCCGKSRRQSRRHGRHHTRYSSVKSEFDSLCIDENGNPMTTDPFKIPDNCTHYYQCSNGYLYTMPCPEGLVFNEEKVYCDYPYNVPECNGCTIYTLLDLAFLIDESASIGYDNFEKMKDFMVALVDDLPVSQTSIRISGTSYATDPQEEWDFLEATDENVVKDFINDLDYLSGGSTYTGAALQFVNDNVFVSDAGDRDDAPDLLILLTDGSSFDKVKEPAQALKDRGITIIVIAIQGDLDMNEINEIASDPDSEHVFEVEDFDALMDIVDDIGKEICQ